MNKKHRLSFSKSCNIYEYVVPGWIEIQLINVLKHTEVGDEKLWTLGTII